jgi:hypothetical protein
MELGKVKDSLANLPDDPHEQSLGAKSARMTPDRVTLTATERATPTAFRNFTLAKPLEIFSACKRHS